MPPVPAVRWLVLLRTVYKFAHKAGERWLPLGVVRPGECFGGCVYKNRLHARQAALALLMMAKPTSDAKLAAHLIDLAANQAGDLPPRLNTEPPGEPTDEEPGRQG
jgi:hypothetical protein